VVTKAHKATYIYVPATLGESRTLCAEPRILQASESQSGNFQDPPSELVRARGCFATSQDQGNTRYGVIFLVREWVQTGYPCSGCMSSQTPDVSASSRYSWGMKESKAKWQRLWRDERSCVEGGWSAHVERLDGSSDVSKILEG